MDRSRKTPRSGGAVGRTISMRPVADLIPPIRNPQRHSPAHVAQIAASIREFGFTIPVLLDERGAGSAGGWRRYRIATLVDRDTVRLRFSASLLPLKADLGT